MMSNCPSRETLDRFVSGEFSFTTDSEIEGHVNQCVTCQKYLEISVRVHNSPLMEIGLEMSEMTAERQYSRPQISGLEIIKLASQGGQGLVFKALDVKLNRPVAVKLLRNISFDKNNRESSILREARSIAQLDHPNIVKLQAMVETDQGPALILDWIDGGSLQEYLNAHSMTESEVIEMLLKLTDAMDHAHSRGILHRDIKPSNVLLRNGSLLQPMLCDFGLAKSKVGKSDFSSTSVGIGTAGYMAPELISRRFGRVSQASDIYSLGAVLYRMVAGIFPHESDSPFETLERTCDQNVVVPSFFNKNLSWDLETICLKCLERDPEARYQNVLELKRDLELFKKKEAIIADRVGWQKRLKTWCREHPWLAGVSTSLFSVMVTGIFILWQLLQQSRESQQIAEAELARTAETFRLSTPMIKRFLQVSSLDPNETKRIVKIADLLRDFGKGDHNLRQRFDLIYSGLEIATELFRVGGQEKLAISMASDARASLSRLIQEYGRDLDQLPWLKSGNKIEISLLDQSMVRYGHACIDLFHMLKHQETKEKEAVGFLKEAIRSAEKVIEKNPEVDEAYSDLANYYVDLCNQEFQEGYKKEAAITIKKALSIHERMIKIYPNDTGKTSFWLNCIQLLLNVEYENHGRSDEFINTINKVRAKMQEIKNQNTIVWQTDWPMFVDCMLRDCRSLYDVADHRLTLIQIDELINIWHEMVKYNGYLRDNLNRLMGMQMDRMILIDEIEGKAAAKAYYQSLFTFWDSAEVKLDNHICLATLYLLDPELTQENMKKSLEILKQLDSSDREVQRLRNIYESMVSGKTLKKLTSVPPTFFDIQMTIRDQFEKQAELKQNADWKAFRNELQHNYLRKLMAMRDHRIILDYLKKTSKFATD